MSTDTQESILGGNAELVSGILYVAVVLGSLVIGIVEGRSHWVFTAVMIAVIGVADLVSDTEARRRRLSLVGILVVLAGSLAADVLLL